MSSRPPPFFRPAHAPGPDHTLLVSEPILGADEKAALARVIDSSSITMGDGVRAFEHAFAEAHGLEDGVAVNSCTAGLHLAIEALGIGSGDEVLVPSLSFVATANAVIYAGATPVFVDVESLQAPVISCEDAARRVSPATKAVIVMHYAGYVVDAAAWRRFADAHGLLLIEDSAHAVGAARGNIFGDAAVFSFFGNKNMTTGEGGMVLSHDPALLRHIRQARGHGMTTSTLGRLAGQAMYDVTMLGYNYRMTELNAALGLVQLAKLRLRNAKRRRLSMAYRRLLASTCPAVTMPFVESQRSSHHILPVLLPPQADRAQVIAALCSEGIQTSIHYPPVHTLTWYRARNPFTHLPITEEFAARELTLPLHPKMEDWQVGSVTQALARALGPNHSGETA